MESEVAERFPQAPYCKDYCYTVKAETRSLTSAGQAPTLPVT